MRRFLKRNILDLSIDEFNTKALLAVSALRDIYTLHTNYRTACFEQSHVLRAKANDITYQIEQQASDTESFEPVLMFENKALINSLTNAVRPRNPKDLLNKLALKIEKDKNLPLLRALLSNPRAKFYFHTDRLRDLTFLSLKLSNQTALLDELAEVRAQLSKNAKLLSDIESKTKINTTKLTNFFS